MFSHVKQCSAQNTSIACEFEGGVIIGADSQGTSGQYIRNRSANKLVKIDNYIYCSGSGAEANIQFIIDSATFYLEAQKNITGGISVITAASVFRDLCYLNRNTLNVDFLIVGWDNINHGQVYSISSGGMMKRESICAIGSGSLFVQGYIDACYTANMNKEEAKELVVKTIKLAILRDTMSGGNIYVVVITNNGVESNQCVNRLSSF